MYHQLINPERPVTAGAQRVHGYSWDMLKNQPRFVEIADEFLEFVYGATLVIHNARFDIGFLNTELKKIGRGCIGDYCNGIVDTLTLARRLRRDNPPLWMLFARHFRLMHQLALSTELLLTRFFWCVSIMP